MKNTTQKVTVHFDGGTPCNVPALGYGIGYGSYSIDGGEPVRLDHGIHCSANTAEILTLCCALEKLIADGVREVHIEGDSQIALKWARVSFTGEPAKISKRASPEFVDAITRIEGVMRSMRSVTVEWKPRRFAVAAFGH